MKDSIKDPIIFLEHVLESIDKIESFVKGIPKEAFLRDELRKSAVVREIEVIGEAVKNLPVGYYVKYPYIEWKDIAGTKDKIVHHYFGIDFEVVWEIVKEDLPQLKKEVKEILQKESKESKK